MGSAAAWAPLFPLLSGKVMLGRGRGERHQSVDQLFQNVSEKRVSCLGSPRPFTSLPEQSVGYELRSA